MTDHLALEDALSVVDELGFVIADAGLFASAIGRPATTVFGVDAYPDLATQAAALLESVARDHALLDGNKRAAWTLTRVFLALNDHGLVVDDDAAEEFVVSVAQGQVDIKASAVWLDTRMAMQG